MRAQCSSLRLDLCDDEGVSIRTDNEAGFSLVEILVAMTIFAMLSSLAIAGYLRTRGTSEAASNREQVSAAYHAIAQCKSENDGFYASYADIKGSYCLRSLTVDGNTKLCNISASGSSCGVNAVSSTTNQGCWNLTSTKSKQSARSLWGSPTNKYDAGDERGFKVGLCTFSSDGTALTANAADSQYVRVSAQKDGKIYFLVEEPSGFHTYIGEDDNSDGQVDSGQCLRRTSGTGPAAASTCLA